MFAALKLSIALAAVAFAAEPDAPIRVQLTSDILTLDPARVEDGSGVRIMRNLMSGLTELDALGKPVLAWAESVNESAAPGGRRNVEFTLRRGAQWSDGVPLTAEQFVWGIRRALDPKTGSKLSSVQCRFEAIEAVAVNRIRFLLGENCPYLRAALALPQAAPSRTPEGGALSPMSPTSGRYRMVSAESGRSWRLVPNALHFDSAARTARPIEWILVTDEATAANLFERDRLDVLSKISHFDLERFRKRGVTRESPLWATFYLGFRTDRPPFDDVRVRCELARSIDRAALVRVLSGERVATSWVPPALGGTEHAFGAGRKGKNGGPKPAGKPLLLGTDSGSRNQLVVERVQADLARRGWRVEIRTLDWKSHLRALESADYALFRFAWLAPFASPIGHLSVFQSDSPNNRTGWRNAEYDAAVRSGKYAQAEAMLFRDCVIVPLYQYTQIHAVSARVREFVVNPLGAVSYERL